MKVSKILLCIGVLASISRATPRYNFMYSTSKALDFRQGKWLINEIKTDLSYQQTENLKNMLLNGFKKAGLQTVYNVTDIKFDYLTLDKFRLPLAPETFNLLAKTTGYDFIVCTQAAAKQNELTGKAYVANNSKYMRLIFRYIMLKACN